MYFEFPTRNIFSKSQFLLGEEKRVIAIVINIVYQPRYMLYKYFSLIRIIPCMNYPWMRCKHLPNVKQERVAART